MHVSTTFARFLSVGALSLTLEKKFKWKLSLYLLCLLLLNSVLHKKRPSLGTPISMKPALSPKKKTNQWCCFLLALTGAAGVFVFKMKCSEHQNLKLGLKQMLFLLNSTSRVLNHKAKPSKHKTAPSNNSLAFVATLLVGLFVQKKWATAKSI